MIELLSIFLVATFVAVVVSIIAIPVIRLSEVLIGSNHNHFTSFTFSLFLRPSFERFAAVAKNSWIYQKGQRSSKGWLFAFLWALVWTNLWLVAFLLISALSGIQIPLLPVVASLWISVVFESSIRYVENRTIQRSEFASVLSPHLEKGDNQDFISRRMFAFSIGVAPLLLCIYVFISNDAELELSFPDAFHLASDIRASEDLPRFVFTVLNDWLLTFLSPIIFLWISAATLLRAYVHIWLSPLRNFQKSILQTSPDKSVTEIVDKLQEMERLISNGKTLEDAASSEKIPMKVAHSWLALIH